MSALRASDNLRHKRGRKPEDDRQKKEARRHRRAEGGNAQASCGAVPSTQHKVLSVHGPGKLGSWNGSRSVESRLNWIGLIIEGAKRALECKMTISANFAVTVTAQSQRARIVKTGAADVEPDVAESMKHRTMKALLAVVAIVVRKRDALIRIGVIGRRPNLATLRLVLSVGASTTLKLGIDCGCAVSLAYSRSDELMLGGSSVQDDEARLNIIIERFPEPPMLIPPLGLNLVAFKLTSQLAWDIGTFLSFVASGRDDEPLELFTYTGCRMSPNLGDVLSAHGPHLRSLVVKASMQNVSVLGLCTRLERFECQRLPPDALVAAIPRTTRVLAVTNLPPQQSGVTSLAYLTQQLDTFPALRFFTRRGSTPHSGFGRLRDRCTQLGLEVRTGILYSSSKFPSGMPVVSSIPIQTSPARVLHEQEMIQLRKRAPKIMRWCGSQPDLLPHLFVDAPLSSQSRTTMFAAREAAQSRGSIQNCVDLNTREADRVRAATHRHPDLSRPTPTRTSISTSTAAHRPPTPHLPALHRSATAARAVIVLLGPRLAAFVPIAPTASKPRRSHTKRHASRLVRPTRTQCPPPRCAWTATDLTFVHSSSCDKKHAPLRKNRVPRPVSPAPHTTPPLHPLHHTSPLPLPASHALSPNIRPRNPDHRTKIRTRTPSPPALFPTYVHRKHAGGAAKPMCTGEGSRWRRSSSPRTKDLKTKALARPSEDEDEDGADKAHSGNEETSRRGWEWAERLAENAYRPNSASLFFVPGFAFVIVGRWSIGPRAGHLTEMTRSGWSVIVRIRVREDVGVRSAPREDDEDERLRSRRTAPTGIGRCERPRIRRFAQDQEKRHEPHIGMREIQRGAPGRATGIKTQTQRQGEKKQITNQLNPEEPLKDVASLPSSLRVLDYHTSFQHQPVAPEKQATTRRRSLACGAVGANGSITLRFVSSGSRERQRSKVIARDKTQNYQIGTAADNSASDQCTASISLADDNDGGGEQRRTILLHS
ncbi:hypothetical protein C8R45DRAFT_1070351 [Mycena sanguinolenta]|nr:hypothetical protein C8R45DRAFT_1070351 [Mycena sanguinolenta]